MLVRPFTARTQKQRDPSMAPSKCHLLAFFLAIAMIAAMPQPSAAVRPEPPTSSTTTQPPNPRERLACLWPFLSPILCPIFAPIFGSILCPPTPPSPPSPPMPPQPKECLTSITGLMPCKDFLTNKTAPPPPYPGKCCDGLKSLLKDTPICLCHLDDGGFDQVLSAHMILENFAALMVDICKSDGPADFGSCSGPVPPVTAPAPGAAS